MFGEDFAEITGFDVYKTVHCIVLQRRVDGFLGIHRVLPQKLVVVGQIENVANKNVG